MSWSKSEDSACLATKKLIYFEALEASCDLAVLDGPYKSIEDSPASKGPLQFDTLKVSPGSGRRKWAAGITLGGIVEDPVWSPAMKWSRANFT